MLTRDTPRRNGFLSGRGISPRFLPRTISLACGVKLAWKREGLRIPDDVSLIGFDGDDIGLYMTPRLTTMWQNSEEIRLDGCPDAAQATCGGKTARDYSHSAKLLIRESCRKIG
jgi:DNA-binding LacI/PurR family transcriptional regulator